MRKIIVFLIFTCFFSCSTDKRQYKIATGPDGGSFKQVGADLSEFLNNNEINFLPLSGEKYHGPANVKYLMDHKVDFALVQNDIDLDSTVKDIQTVVPLFNETLFIIYKKGIKENNLKMLLKGRRVGLGPREGGSYRFVLKVLKYYNIDTTEFKPVFSNHVENCISDSIDVSIVVSGYNNYRIINMLNNGGELFSLDDYNMLNKGSSAEGFSMNYPFSKPLLIPKNLYGDKPEKPVLTLSFYVLLITREDMNSDIIKEVAKTIIDNRQTLRDKNPLLTDLTDKFDINRIKFPLHTGTIQYLERNEPSFIERYSEVISILITIIAAIGGGISSFISWNKRKKKNRIDVYYLRLIEIEKEMNIFRSDHTRLFELKNEISILKENSFKELADEMLTADESFNIYLNLLYHIEKEINVLVY